MFLLLAVEQGATIAIAAGGATSALAVGAGLLVRRRAKAKREEQDRLAAPRAMTGEEVSAVLEDMRRHFARHRVRYGPEQMRTAATQKVRRVASETGRRVPADLADIIRVALGRHAR